MTLKTVLAATAILTAISAGAAPILFSVTGTATDTKMGYTEGDAYSFNWILNEFFSDGGAGNIFDSNSNRWGSHFVSEPILWTYFAGDGLDGTYNRPNAPSNSIRVDNTGLTLQAGHTDLTGSMGLTVNGVDIKYLQASRLIDGLVDYSATSFINPATFWGNYFGTYTNSPNGQILIEDESDSSIVFRPTSVTISPIPEPATLVIIGFGSGLVLIFRRLFMI